MATTDTPPSSIDGTESWELPQWQYDDFSRKIQRWGDKCTLKGTEDPLPEVVNCYYSQNPKAAFHFDAFGRILLRWQGASCDEPFDVLNYLRDEEPKILSHLKKLMLSMETDFENGRFLGRTCAMEIKDIHMAVYGTNERAPSSKPHTSIPGCLLTQLKGIAANLDEDPGSGRWGFHYACSTNLLAKLLDTLEGLESLLQQHEKTTDLPKSQEGEVTPAVDGKTGNEQAGLRRRRPNIQGQTPTPNVDAQNPQREPKDHTPVEAMFLLTKALNVAFRQIPFADLRDALWKDPRAPTSLSLIFTSVSSILIGVALATHNHFACRWGNGIDDGFFTLLSTTITQLFSLYILLLPLLRGQEPHLRGLWFCLSIGLSAVLSIISCIVYAFSWHASAVLEFGGTLASMIAALLLVQGIDKGVTAKETEAVNGDV